MTHKQTDTRDTIKVELDAPPTSPNIEVRTTPTKTECCEECNEYVKDHVAEMMVPACRDEDCPCHTPKTECCEHTTVPYGCSFDGCPNFRHQSAKEEKCCELCEDETCHEGQRCNCHSPKEEWTRHIGIDYGYTPSSPKEEKCCDECERPISDNSNTPTRACSDCPCHSPKLTTVEDVVRDFDNQFGEVGYDGFAEKETTDNIKSFLRTQISSLLTSIQGRIESDPLIHVDDKQHFIAIIKEVKSSKKI